MCCSPSFPKPYSVRKLQRTTLRLRLLMLLLRLQWLVVVLLRLQWLVLLLRLRRSSERCMLRRIAPARMRRGRRSSQGWLETCVTATRLGRG